MEESKDNVQRPYKGIVTDTHPTDQPNETYRYALNGVNSQESGSQNFVSMEASISQCDSFPEGSTLLATQYMTDDLTAVFLCNGQISYIGTVNRSGKYVNHVTTNQLGLSAKYPISSTFRIRQNNTKVIYWTDGFHHPRLFNFDREFDFYSTAYEQSDKSVLFSGEKWEMIKFDLIKTYTQIPSFSDVSILNTGNIPSGAYSVSIQLVDENLSPTEWITVSNPVPIFIDSLDLEYHAIRGSRNTTSSAQNFQNASKSIKWTFSNLDPNFAFYRVAVICANAGTGQANKALVSQLIPIDNKKFIYSGNDGDFSETPISDIQQTKIDIDSALYIEQLENRLILAGIKGKQIDWCSFQQIASKIKSERVTESVVLNDVDALGNPKNPKSSFSLTGYMWGEVYSFGIVYVFKDGFRSPVYHIPGRTQDAVDTEMDFYECSDSVYPPIHGCTTYNYWGKNGYNSETLTGKKIRHHKFPKRPTPLFDKASSVDIIQEDVTRLSVTMMFAVPVLFIPGTSYTGTVTVKNALTDQIIGVNHIILYEGTESNDQFFVGEYKSSLNPAIESIVFTETPTLEFTYTESTDTASNVTSIDSIVTDICGIKFTSIERPHVDVIGFEIVRNERTDDDRIVVDNVIIGPLMSDTTDTNNPYNAFGLLMPDIEDNKKSPNGVYIFSPEHQFENRKLLFDSIQIHGSYTRMGKGYIPLTIDGENGNGVYIQDVQAGTSFNSSYNKGEDPDGFDLQVLYRSSDLIYTPVSDVTLPPKEKLFYLSAAGNMIRDEDIFFNASIDNKIMVATFDSENAIDPSIFSSGGNARIFYASLINNNTTAYSNFINRTYFKQGNNVNLFGSYNTVSSQNIFNGDSYVAPMTINSSVFYNTYIGNSPKKSRVWKIVVGSILVVAGIVGAVFTAGASLSLTAAGLAVAATTLAISYGVSMLTSGIEFETMKNMIDQHYTAGLKVCIQDNDNKDANYMKGNGERSDDRFQWFTDRLQNVYFESSINIALRSGLTTSVSDFVNTPSLSLKLNVVARQSYEVYLMNKFTVIDREQNSGRLYLGYAMSEVYDINPDYMKQNHEKPVYHLPIEYDCCSKKIEDFSNRIHYSEQSFQEEKIDNFRNFLVNNYRDVEGQFGKISNIFRFSNTLYIHTTESLLMLPQNLQERINTDLITFIGTGEFFSVPPRKIMDGENGSFGSSDKQATVITRQGVMFVNSKEGIPYMLSQSPKDISAGNSIWFKQNLRLSLHDVMSQAVGSIYEPLNNPIDPRSVGITAVYDAALSRIIVTKLDYVPVVTPVLYSKFGSQAGKLVYNPIGNVFTVDNQIIPFSNKIWFENKSFTMSYSLITQSWISYHSYMPKIYFSTLSSLYSSVENKLYRHHNNSSFGKYYGVRYPFILEYASVSNPLQTRITDSVSLIVQGKKYIPLLKSYVNDDSVFFDKVVFSNSSQCSGEVRIKNRYNHTTKNYLLNQVKNVQSEIGTEKIEGIWTLNEIRDYITNYTIPFTSSAWTDIKDIYPIDKTLNPLAFAGQKQWWELESLRDTYLIIRLIFSNFEDTNTQLSANYSIENEQPSLR